MVRLTPQKIRPLTNVAQGDCAGFEMDVLVGVGNAIHLVAFCYSVNFKYLFQALRLRMASKSVSIASSGAFSLTSQSRFGLMSIFIAPRKYSTTWSNLSFSNYCAIIGLSLAMKTGTLTRFVPTPYRVPSIPSLHVKLFVNP